MLLFSKFGENEHDPRGSYLVVVRVFAKQSEDVAKIALAIVPTESLRIDPSLVRLVTNSRCALGPTLGQQTSAKFPRCIRCRHHARGDAAEVRKLAFSSRLANCPPSP